MYTNDENVNLSELFKAMDASKEALPSEKDNKAIRTYFENVYPSMDFERVYNSDMKKMVRWYSVIKTHNIEIKLSEVAEDNGEEG